MKKLLFCLCFLLSGCSTFLFYPTREYVTDLHGVGIPVKDICLETPDKVRLNAWFVPAFDPKTKTETPAKGTILFLHGTGDTFVPCDMTKRAFDACTAPKQLVLVPDAGHGCSYLVDRPRVQSELQAFLSKYVSEEEPI